MIRKHLRAIVFLPGTVTIIVPGLLLWWRGIQFGWGLAGVFAGVSLIGGAVILLAGVYLLARSIHLFAAEGNGTLAPWDPTDTLVVTGPYCYVRNPMYVGVLGILLGEAILFGSLWVAGWFIAVFLAFNLFVRLYEEPHLHRTYGEQYATYCANVPRWLPRIRPWMPDGPASSPPHAGNRGPG
jgi:protein-S-isoprenylcysteine O-methyltransferase Ste14